MLWKPVFNLVALVSAPLVGAFVIPYDPQVLLANHEQRLPESSPLDQGVDAFTRPSWFTSTLLARRLLALSSSGVVSTTFPDPVPSSAHAPSSVAGLPIGLREYTADCNSFLPEHLSNDDNGDPTILALRVATTFKNINAGSNLSLELDWWDHIDQAGPVYPGLPRSPAALPRVTLFGYLEALPPLTDEAATRLEQCFLQAHPDAKVWLPGASGSPHSSFWARLIVTHAYWIGGFGDVQQIGWMNVTEWKGIRRESSMDGVGDGRGWTHA
ncbi:hypothetical protein N7468_000685 [Penicillium chermesinum]|uniref:CREG-like beta-barrel domain-containing protein n=1 Tax=Penicillium chermesinum TaxID=63820 RepID=A0A9W9PNT5_9EURO|nr:uncharacterized protein N7468_000685 [Penicillium chermesinum]KAJ5249234.1 hypothetical protein N7468_000685 [Penicillium chermesinum]